MPIENYEAVREAAEALATSASRDTWQLADAVLAAVPALPNGGNRAEQRGGVTPVPEALRELADQLAIDGVVNSRGEPWTRDTLDDLRDTAMRWPPAERLPACAFYTHREAKSADRKLALRELVAYAEGKAVDGIEERIRERIDNRVARGARYLVAVDDMRLHLGRQPTRWPPPGATPATPEQLAAALADPERVAEAVEQMDDEQADAAFSNVNRATAYRPTSDPELAEDRREVRRQRQQPPSAYDMDVVQAGLARDAAKAVRKLLHSFAEHRPEPDGLAVQAVEHLRGLVDQLAVLLATPDAIEEGIRRLLAEEGR